MASQVPPPPQEPPDDPRHVGWSGPEFQLPVPPPDDIDGYLRENARRYTREALTARLAAAGHPPEVIAAAWAKVDEEDAAHGRRDRRAQVSRTIGLAYLITWGIVTLLWLVSAPPEMAVVFSTSALFALSLAVPGVLGFVLTRDSRRLRRAGLGSAVAFATLPLLCLVALTGICVAIVPPGAVQ